MKNTTCFPALALAVLLCSAPGAARGQGRVSFPLAAFPLEITNFQDWMSAGGWQSKRDEPRGCEAGNGVLHLVSDNNSVLIGTERGFPRDVYAAPVLRLRLKVPKVPAGTDLPHKSGDDAAFRVYVAFDKGGGFLSPPNTIAYTWTENLDPGTVVQSEYFSNLTYISLGKGPTPGDEWVDAERDLVEDYRRIFHTDPVPQLRGIMIKCDTNDTGSSAEAWLASVEIASKGREDGADGGAQTPAGLEDIKGCALFDRARAFFNEGAPAAEEDLARWY